MAETDFGIIGDPAGDVARGVSAGFTPPNGGGVFVFGFNSRVTGSKSVGLFYNGTNFAPLRNDAAPQEATGGSVRACVKRGRSSNATGFSVGIFVNLMATTVTDQAYILGLSNSDPSNIVLMKTALGLGLDPTQTTFVLRTSSETFLWDTWVHLRLDSIVNPNGDVVLKCYKSNLTDHPCITPEWEAITGMTDFIDDSLGVASSSNPLGGGYGGFFFQSSISGACGFVDQFQMFRQM